MLKNDTDLTLSYLKKRKSAHLICLSTSSNKIIFLLISFSIIFPDSNFTTGKILFAACRPDQDKDISMLSSWSLAIYVWSFFLDI